MNNLVPKASEFMVNGQYINLMDLYYLVKEFNGIDNVF